MKKKKVRERERGKKRKKERKRIIKLFTRRKKLGSGCFFPQGGERRKIIGVKKGWGYYYLQSLGRESNSSIVVGITNNIVTNTKNFYVICFVLCRAVVAL